MTSETQCNNTRCNNQCTLTENSLNKALAVQYIFEFRTKTVKNTVGYQMYLKHILYSIMSLYRILLCSHRSHIWDKAPMRPHVRHNVLYEEEEIEGYSPKTLPKRCDTWPGSHTTPLGSHIHDTLISFHTT